MVSDNSDKSTELVLPRADVDRVSDHDLRNMRDFESVLTQLNDSDLPVLSSADHIGSGSELIKDKAVLIGIPFIALRWHFSQTDDYDSAYFVTVHVLTKMGDRFVFNDGTRGGIRDQLMELSTNTERFEMLVCEKGLRVSEYEYTDEHTGKKSRATSWYIG